MFRQIRDIQKEFAGSEISIIAHSFGTHLISEILRREFDLKVKKLIFIGSVVPYDFPFENFSGRFEGKILNEVGTHDLWPALAESVTTGYGSTGTFGFKNPRVYDVWNASTHSEMLTEQHCEERWVPFLTSGSMPQNTGASRVPWWIKLVTFVKIKYIVVALFLCALFWYSLTSIARSDAPLEFQMYPDKKGGGWSLSDGDFAKTVNEKLDENCKLEEYFGINCRGRLGRYLTQRDWRHVKYYDSDLNKIQFPDKFEITTKNPLDVWNALEEAYPECICVEDDGMEIAFNLADTCKLDRIEEE